MPILNNITRVLVLRCGALGDLVYATSVIDALRREYGEGILIDFIATPGSAKLFENDPRVRRVFPLTHKKLPIWLSPQKRSVIRASEEEPYDLFINFEMGKQFKSLCSAVRARHTYGWFFERPVFGENEHMVDICKAFYAPVLTPEVLKAAAPRIIGKAFPDIQNRLGLKERYLVLSPSNSHNKKRGVNYRAWPQSHWKKLISLLPGDLSIVIVGGKGEEPFFEAIRPYPPNVIDLVGKTSITEMIGVIDHAMGLVVTDTGTAHIASAVNTPVFCLIGPTPAHVTGPYRSAENEVHILSAGLECSPCYKTPIMEQCRDNLCMHRISPEMVVESLKSANVL